MLSGSATGGPGCLASSEDEWHVIGTVFQVAYVALLISTAERRLPKVAVDHATPALGRNVTRSSD